MNVQEKQAGNVSNLGLKMKTYHDLEGPVLGVLGEETDKELTEEEESRGRT